MASIQGIYVALFGRPADPTGLQYFNAQTHDGTDLSTIGDLTQTAEYKTRFSGMTTTQIINSIYQSLFERDGDQAGIDFYLGEMAAGRLTINTIAIAILDGAKGTDKTTVDAKIAAANLFTSHLDLQTEVNAYGPSNASGGKFAITVGQQYLTGVNAAAPHTPAEADAAILRLFASAGQAPAGGDDTSGGGGSLPSTDHVFLYDSNNNLKASAQTLAVFEGEGYTPLRAAAQQGDVAVVMGYDNIVANISHAVEWYANWPLGDISGQLPFDLSNFPAGGINIAGLFTIEKPANLFLNFPSFNDAPVVSGLTTVSAEVEAATKLTSMTGTGQNDIMLFLDNGDQSHTAQGNGGQDIIISVSNDFVRSIPALLTGNVSDYSDLFTQGTGVHTLSGGEGNDIIISAGGNNNVLTGDAGNDVIVSLLDANDTINGGDGNDIIFGGPDHQLIYARAAVSEDVVANDPFPSGDTITGGAGNDTFVYSAQGSLDDNLHIDNTHQASQLLGNGYDTITDFKANGDADKIMLLMDAPAVHPTLAVPGSQTIYVSDNGYSVNYNEGTAASYSAAQTQATASFQQSSIDLSIYVAAVGSDTYVFVDDNADQKTDFAIKLQDFSDLSKIDITDFTLVNTPDVLDNILSFIGSTDMQKLMVPENM